MSMLERIIGYRRQARWGGRCVDERRGEAPETNKKAGKRKGFRNPRKKGAILKLVVSKCHIMVNEHWCHEIAYGQNRAINKYNYAEKQRQHGHPRAEVVDI